MPSEPRFSSGANASAYAVAAAVSIAAVGVTIVVPELHQRPYLLPAGAVALSAWIGGFGPALWSTVLALLGVNAFLERTEGWGWQEALTAALFAAVALLIATSARALRQAAAEARHHGARLEAVFRQAAVGLAQLTPGGHFERVNRRMATIVGRTAEDLDGGSFVSITHPDERRLVETALAELAAGTATGFATDLRGLRPDGTSRWLHVALSPLIGDEGPVGVIAIVEDIHERRLAEERAQLSDERARQALAIARLGTWSWVPGSEVVEADDRTREVCGLPTSGPVTFEAVVARVHPDDWPRVQQALGHAVESGGVYAEEFRFVHEDGSLRWVVSRGQVTPAGEGPGAPPVMLGTVLDITDRRNAEDALRLADRQKDDFLALLSHELRNPLAPIRTALHLLRMRGGGPDPEGQRLHRVMERQVQHLVHLVDDLLDVSRVLRGRIELRLQRLDLAEVAAAAVETTRPSIDAQAQHLQVEWPEHPVYVHGDRVRLSQALGNLLHNGSKFTGRGGTITLSLWRDGEQAIVRVRDTGAGIAPDVLPTIFEPFVQADRSLERSQGGLGIGLTLVRRIVELHGGRVHAESAGLGRGSTFVVRLPALEGAGVPPRADAAGSRSPLRPGLRVLVVDDNTDAADSLAALLAARGQMVSVAYDGREALDRALAERPDIVLLDVGLPGLNGYDLAAELRRQAGWRPVLLAITGYGQDADARRAAEAGFDRHLVKPVDAAELERTLAALVGVRDE